MIFGLCSTMPGYITVKLQGYTNIALNFLKYLNKKLTLSCKALDTVVAESWSFLHRLFVAMGNSYAQSPVMLLTTVTRTGKLNHMWTMVHVSLYIDLRAIQISSVGTHAHTLWFVTCFKTYVLHTFLSIVFSSLKKKLQVL